MPKPQNLIEVPQTILNVPLSIVLWRCFVRRALLPAAAARTGGTGRVAGGAWRPGHPGGCRAAGARVARSAGGGGGIALERDGRGAPAAAAHVRAIHGVRAQRCVHIFELLNCIWSCGLDTRFVATFQVNTV